MESGYFYLEYVLHIRIVVRLRIEVDLIECRMWLYVLRISALKQLAVQSYFMSKTICILLLLKILTMLQFLYKLLHSKLAAFVAMSSCKICE